jgi:hypothetical protein
MESCFAKELPFEQELLLIAATRLCGYVLAPAVVLWGICSGLTPCVRCDVHMADCKWGELYFSCLKFVNNFIVGIWRGGFGLYALLILIGNPNPSRPPLVRGGEMQCAFQ